MNKFNDICIIIPVYNGEKYILEAVISVERQTLLPKQIIIINDGSSDNTEKIILNYQRKATIPIKYYKKKHEGPNSARNYGLRITTSEYVAFLDADDVWFPDKLRKQMAVFRLNEYPNLGLVYTDYSFVDEQGIDIDAINRFKLERSVKGDVRRKLLVANKIAGSASAVLIKRECFEKVGMFDEKLLACEDWDMWLRIANFFSFDYVPEVLVKIRRHSKSAQQNYYFSFHERLRFYSKLLDSIEAKIDNIILKNWYEEILFELYICIWNGELLKILFSQDLIIILKLISKNSSLFVKLVFVAVLKRIKRIIM